MMQYLLRPEAFAYLVLLPLAMGINPIIRSIGSYKLANIITTFAVILLAVASVWTTFEFLLLSPYGGGVSLMEYIFTQLEPLMGYALAHISYVLICLVPILPLGIFHGEYMKHAHA